MLLKFSVGPAVGATLLALLASPAGACQTMTLTPKGGADFVNVRSNPSLDGKELWRMSAGSQVRFCSGRTITDARGITWLWVEFETTQEPWLHKGWISSVVAAATSAPMQSTTPVQTANIPATKDAEWQSMWSNSLREGAKYFRTCQPEIKSCIRALSGGDYFMRETYNSNDVIMSRDICKFNASHDIRDCVDFDTHVRSKSMQDVKGNWSTIE